MAASKRRGMSAIFIDSPSMQQIENDRKYRKTLEGHRNPIQNGMMIPLEDLEDFPAPVLCSYCKNPVISRMRIDRSGKQMFNIGLANFVSVGFLTYDVVSSNKDYIHECPSCKCALARYVMKMNGGYHEIKVYRTHDASTFNQPPKPSGSGGHRAEGFNVSGYATVHIGDRNYYTIAES